MPKIRQHIMLVSSQVFINVTKFQNVIKFQNVTKFNLSCSNQSTLARRNVLLLLRLENHYWTRYQCYQMLQPEIRHQCYKFETTCTRPASNRRVGQVTPNRSIHISPVVLHRTFIVFPGTFKDRIATVS